MKKLKSFFHWNSFIAKTRHQCNLQSVFFLPEIFQNKKVRVFFKLYEKWFLFVILSLCLGFFPLFFYFLLSTHLSFLDPLEGKKWNSCRRICIQFYRTESLGKGGSATLPVSLGASCSPLGETHSSSNQVTVMRLRKNRLQFPSLLQKWKMGVNEFLHVANLQCFSSGSQGLAEPVSPSLPSSQVELQAQSQVKSFPPPWLQLSRLYFSSHLLSQ